jgi:hypothetical protein
VHDPLQAGHVVGIAHRFKQFEHPHEHRRDELAVRDAVTLDARERLFGVELLHHNHGPAQRLHHHRPERRRGVVQRRRAQVHRIAGYFNGVHQGHQNVGRFAGRKLRKFAADPLGPAGGPRRVLQQITLAFVGEGRLRLVGNAFRVT